MIFIRCDECKQLFGREPPSLPPEPGQPEGYLGEPGKIVYALGAVVDVLERHDSPTAFEGLLQTMKIVCPGCMQDAVGRGRDA